MSIDKAANKAATNRLKSHPVKEVKTVGYKAGVSSLVRFLSDKVDLRALETHELEWLSELSGPVSQDMSQLADMVEGIGCLVMNDDDSGHFQTQGDIGRLLFTISNSISICAETLEISGEAYSTLQLKQGKGA
ncbi:hypothetical protein QYH69_15790 [Paraburkholderia sp. SARCC-3016]|uniref:hypothetical protein n=1 Tax=Paraburkholderia sp. SARCC-3016 TaxID=3058611 RepID=UPI00280984D2|nr:hypothetical protein [Paraburkholderia sp. SARCC-3016]MDQ7978713.1 hypothetical protein [Paraburkholderia sp. SARCC-3016]